MASRFAAWVVCGPLGHLYGGVVDWLELLGRYGWARLAARLGRAGGRGGQPPDWAKSP